MCQVEFPAVSGVFYSFFFSLLVNGIVCIIGVVSQCGINEAQFSVLFYSIVLQFFSDCQVQHPRRGFFILELTKTVHLHFRCLLLWQAWVDSFQSQWWLRRIKKSQYHCWYDHWCLPQEGFLKSAEFSHRQPFFLIINFIHHMHHMTGLENHSNSAQRVNNTLLFHMIVVTLTRGWFSQTSSHVSRLSRGSCVRVCMFHLQHSTGRKFLICCAERKWWARVHLHVCVRVHENPRANHSWL